MRFTRGRPACTAASRLGTLGSRPAAVCASDEPYWLLRLTRNLAIDHLRANRLIPTATVLNPNASSGLDLDRTETVKAALATLPDEQRQVVVLRHLVGLTPGEIADRMGRSEGSIHGLHHRGRRALKRELERLDSAPVTPVQRERVAA